jgi:hypothetical protein
VRSPFFVAFALNCSWARADRTIVAGRRGTGGDDFNAIREALSATHVPPPNPRTGALRDCHRRPFVAPVAMQHSHSTFGGKSYVTTDPIPVISDGST